MLDLDEVAHAIEVMRLAGVDVQRYEVKSSVQKLPKTVPETISAFANGSGGILILGLSEEDSFSPVRGFDFGRMQAALSEVCSDKMTPPVRPDIQLMEFEGSCILVAEIPEFLPRDKPCYITERGKYQGSFIRTGDGDRKLSGYEIDRLIEEHVQPRYDIELVSEATMDDLDPALVSGLLKRERDEHPRVFGRLDDTEALIDLRAVAYDEDHVLRPTLAGLLSLGLYPQKYFPRLTVTFASFPGTTKAEIISSGRRLLDSATLVGPISALIAETVATVSRNMRTGALIEGAFRKDVTDYPPIAIREAVANALMHRDYSPDARGTQVQVNMYADRLEIINPGGLYGTVTVDMLGESGVSSTRNQHLSTLLEATPYPDGGFVVENRGTGYQEIEARLAEALMPRPIPKDTISMFSLTFSKRHLTAGERGSYSPVDVKGAILKMLEERGSVSTREIMDSSGLSRAGVMRHINNLLDEGAIEPTEPSRSPRQRYRLMRV